MARRAVDDLSTNSDSDYSNSWISWFLSSKGNEYFCQVEEDYILDRFNLTGLNAEVQNYSQALDLITDSLDDEIEDEFRGSIEVSARFLYGLIHARWIITTRGLAKMLEKYKKAEFGRCPRVLCQSQPLLPVGLTDVPYEKSVKLYCGRCEDIYSPKSSRHGSIDGAYFGSSFPHMLFLVYPWILPNKQTGIHDMGLNVTSMEGSRGRRRDRGEEGHHLGGLSALASSTAASTREKDERDRTSAAPSASGTVGEDQISTADVAAHAERYRPRIFGFQISEIAKLQRWQEAMRDRQIARLQMLENRQD